MKIVLLRVGIDSGCGGIQAPLFEDGSFEFLPIPDGHGLDERTYVNTMGRHGRLLASYFPSSRRGVMQDQSMHVDPEWTTFTYGDPTTPKANLRLLEAGDLLVFYCGLQRWSEPDGWDTSSRPALYLAGYFEVELAGLAMGFDETVVHREFAENFHVRHCALYEAQKQRLVLVKGDTAKSRLYHKAHRISAEGRDRLGLPLKILSPQAQQVFGDFDGRIAIQRSTPRWVRPESIDSAAAFLRSLE